MADRWHKRRVAVLHAAFDMWAKDPDSQRPDLLSSVYSACGVTRIDGPLSPGERTVDTYGHAVTVLLAAGHLMLLWNAGLQQFELALPGGIIPVDQTIESAVLETVVPIASGSIESMLAPYLQAPLTSWLPARLASVLECAPDGPSLARCVAGLYATGQWALLTSRCNQVVWSDPVPSLLLPTRIAAAAPAFVKTEGSGLLVKYR